MPNTEVKLTNAESTWPEAAREDRKLLIKEKTLTNVGVFSYAGASLHAIKAILTVKRHRSNRIVALCYYSVSRLSHKAFLTPFRMTIEGKGVIRRKTIISGRQSTIFDIRYLCFYFLENFCLLTAASHL